MRTVPACAALRAITRVARLPARSCHALSDLRRGVCIKSREGGGGHLRSLSSLSPSSATCPGVSHPAAPPSAAPPSLSSPSSLLFSRSSSLRPRLQLAPRFSPRRFARYCSCARMCLRGQTDVSGSVDVTQGREVLPTSVKPLNYNVELEPDFQGFKYQGKVAIDVEIVEKTNELCVNSLEIEIGDVKLDVDGKTLIPKTKDYNADIQTDKFTFEEPFSPGTKATLMIDFVGTLNDKMAGFYRSSYTDKKTGEQKWLATTQMEPTDARRAVPCFDQPDMKSSWEVTLITDKDLTALSNMDVKTEKDLGNGKKATTFNKTPIMSTYLLAFVVGDLRYKETNAFRLPIRTYTIPGDEEYADFSLEVAAKTLALYEKLFGVPYPLPKMDMVAIPDFAAGAMENWGLITYRVVDLLFDAKTASVDRKQRLAETVQHELAHQWFGNLVTMDFWEGLWLNEGFATWMSIYSMNKFNPEWKVWENYVVEDMASALNLDGLRSSHPIEVPVKRVADINQIFDAISYSKGSAVIRMVSKYLGEDVFLEGIRRYLKKHAYGNTQTSDLWAALSEASGKDVAKAMANWTKKTGYPVVHVTEEGKKIHLEQHRYLKTADVKPEEDETLWTIFVGLREKEGINEDIIFDGRKTTIDLKDSEFYKINADQTAMYRTLYTPERLKKLGKDAEAGLLSVEDRAGLVADSGSLAQSGYLKTSALLELISGFKSEDRYVVWSELLGRISALRGAWMFEPEKEKKALKRFTRELISPVAHKLGWELKEGEPDVLHQLKAMAFQSAGAAGDPVVVKAAMEMFEKIKNGKIDEVNPNLRTGVYAIALAHGENDGEKEWETVYQVFSKGRNNDEKNGALRSLGRSKNPKNIKKTLDLALNGEVRDQDIYLPIQGLRAHREGSEALWTWFKDNWDELKKRLPAGLSMLGSVVSMCANNFTTQEGVEEITQFFKGKDTKGFDRSLEQALDNVRAKALWVSRDRDDVVEYLKKSKLIE